jgi:hypothetical protein
VRFIDAVLFHAKTPSRQVAKRIHTLARSAHLRQNGAFGAEELAAFLATWRLGVKLKTLADIR